MLTWRSVDARTGQTVEEFPGARTRSDLCQIIGRGEPIEIELPWPDRIPPRWSVATTPGRMVLICEDDTTGRIWWGGLITGRGYGSGPALTVSAAAPENLLERSFVPDRRFDAASQTAIMRWLGLDWLADHLHGRVEEAPSPVTRDRTYADLDDKARLDAMQDLMGVIGGPEFTTWWETRPDGTAGLVAATADRLGLKATADRPAEHELYPDEWSLDESYADGKGAPIVRASTTKEGTDGGEQEKVIAERRAQDLLDAGWVPLEHRFSPETGSVTLEVIGAYADGRLADIRDGTTVLACKLPIADFPAAIHLGDDVSVVLRNSHMPQINFLAPGTPGADAPSEIIADARMLGWSMAPEDGELTHVTPVLELGTVRW